MQISKTKQTITREYLIRLRKTWGSELNELKRVGESNLWAASMLRYFLGCVQWTKTELIKLDRKTRRILFQNQCHNANASIERLYLPRKEGGRGLKNVEQAWEREVLSVAMYLIKSDDPQVKGTLKHQRELSHMGKRCMLADACKTAEKYNLELDLLQAWDKTDLPANVQKQR